MMADGFEERRFGRWKYRPGLKQLLQVIASHFESLFHVVVRYQKVIWKA